MKKNKTLKTAFPHTLPVMTGYLFMGTAFGILLVTSGYSPVWAPIMALTVFAGSMQFVAIGILTSPFGLLSAFFLTIMVNARHLFYGLSMLDKFKNTGKKKLYMIFSLTDETYSLHCSLLPPPDVDENLFRFYIALLNHFYWISGCTFGALLGSFIPFSTKGIDFVMTALFVVIFIEQWEKSKNHTSALCGVLITFFCLLIFGTQIFLIPALAGIMILLLFARPHIIEKREK